METVKTISFVLVTDCISYFFNKYTRNYNQNQNNKMNKQRQVKKITTDILIYVHVQRVTDTTLLNIKAFNVIDICIKTSPADMKLSVT